MARSLGLGDVIVSIWLPRAKAPSETWVEKWDPGRFYDAADIALHHATRHERSGRPTYPLGAIIDVEGDRFKIISTAVGRGVQKVRRKR